MPDPRIIELRRHLQRKFPAAHREFRSPPASPPTPHPLPVPPPVQPAPHVPWQPFAIPARGILPSPLPPLPRGTVSEIVAAGPACGCSLVLAALLAEPPPATVTTTLPLALVDARDSFDPDSFTAADCARLLWIRCRTTDHALAATDLLVRDGNLPLVLLDLAALPARELRRIHHATWHRLRQLAGDRGPALLVLCPTPTVPCATLRLTLATPLTLDHLDLPRHTALRSLHPQTTRLRHAL